MEINYKRINNILGWLLGIAASAIYIITSEPTASFWDCGEYIATAYKLQVGHPPGAPFFQMLGRFFSLFASEPSQVARMVNTMSAMSSGFTIMFLFWSITHLGNKLVAKLSSANNQEVKNGNVFAVLGAGLVGALAFTFTDSFWFSAVEGEVYAMSTFFTAIVFWAILKWERVADEPFAYRWIILIAFLVGLSIGVHLLNLLAIPAITLVYYFRNAKKITTKKIIVVSVISVLILALVMYIIIPWVVSIAGLFERIFVNGFGLPFNTGTVIYFVLLIGGIVWGLRYSRKKGKMIMNTIVLGFTFILIGYSSFFMLVIRSNANTPIDQNNPENAISLLAYLNREQYGDWPIFSGTYYNAPRTGVKDGKKVYGKRYLVKNGERTVTKFFTKQDAEDYVKKSNENLSIRGRYIVTNSRENTVPVFDKRFHTLFPRMWSQQRAIHASDYRKWAHKNKGKTVTVNVDGKQEIRHIPTFGENLAFFFKYQLGHMYFRYFMWNFSGRQNDIQGHGDLLHGNWISGIKIIDEARLGPQDDLPYFMETNKGRNKFFMLPLILGLIGLVFHFRKHQRDALVVTFLFIFTGIAIVVYLNQYPHQPRERDYAYAASFMAFCIWIGLGVIAIYHALRKYINPSISAVAVTVLSLFLVPAIMASEGWDDHDRSNRYTALAVAKNYLNSCEKNAILFTNGDNDTFPLWYAQEVENYRTDVRVVNLSLLSTDWYIDQMARKAYESEPVPFSLTREQYRFGSRDYVYFIEHPKFKNSYIPLRLLFRDFIGNDNILAKYKASDGSLLDYFPTKRLRIPVDSAKMIEKGIVSSENATMMVDNVDWKLNKGGIMKNHLMVLDMLSVFDWDRPVYFAITTGNDSYVGLTDYFQIEGLGYRLVPLKTIRLTKDYIPRPKETISPDGQIGRIEVDKMYNNLMNKFEFGNINDSNVYLDETNMRMVMNFRNIYGRLANELVRLGRNDSALAVVDRCLKEFPNNCVPYDFFVLPLAEVCYEAGDIETGRQIVAELLDIYEHDLNFYLSFKGKKASKMINKIDECTRVFGSIAQVTNKYRNFDKVPNELVPVTTDSLFSRSKELHDTYKSFINSYSQRAGIGR